MEIADSARRHGISDDDILHGIRNPVRDRLVADRLVVICTDSTGRWLELVVMVDQDEPTVIHAMFARDKTLQMMGLL